MKQLPCSNGQLIYSFCLGFVCLKSWMLHNKNGDFLSRLVKKKKIQCAAYVTFGPSFLRLSISLIVSSISSRIRSTVFVCRFCFLLPIPQSDDDVVVCSMTFSHRHTHTLLYCLFVLNDVSHSNADYRIARRTALSMSRKNAARGTHRANIQILQVNL